MLLKAKANPNIQNNYGYTALIHARNNKEIVVMLLEAGANPNIKNNLGETAVTNASKYYYNNVAKILKNASKK
jgi:ankyrin repeat protein